MESGHSYFSSRVASLGQSHGRGASTLHRRLVLTSPSLRLRVSKGFALTWYRALTWYFLCLSSLRTHFKPWKALDTRGRGSLAAQ